MKGRKAGDEDEVTSPLKIGDKAHVVPDEQKTNAKKMLAFAGDKSGATLAANDVAGVVVGDGVPTHVNSSMHSMQVDQATNDKAVEEVPEEGSGKGDVSGVKTARRTYKKKPRPANAGGDSPSAAAGDGRKRSMKDAELNLEGDAKRGRRSAQDGGAELDKNMIAGLPEQLCGDQ